MEGKIPLLARHGFDANFVCDEHTRVEIMEAVAQENLRRQDKGKTKLIGFEYRGAMQSPGHQEAGWAFFEYEATPESSVEV